MPAATRHRGVAPDESDPTVVHSLAVTTDDLVTAIEANVRRDAGAVLRVTPPFSGRMRARIHVEHDDDPPEPLCVPPERFVEPISPFPSPDTTEDELRADPDISYTRSRHRRRHEAAVEEWRAAIRESRRDRITVRIDDGSHEVRVAWLG